MQAGLVGILLAAGLALGAPSACADNLSALYRVTWAGLPAAQIRLTLHDSAGGDGGGHDITGTYRDEIVIGTEGLSWLVTHFRGIAVSEGTLAAGGAPVPADYASNYDLRRRKDRELRMNFVLRGGAAVAERAAGDTSRKPELAERFRRNVIDPLSVMTLIRAAVRRGETAFSIPVYDGARRFDAEVRVLPRDRASPGVHLALMLRAVAGFKGESSEDGDPDDAPRPVSLTFSDDGKLIPLAMSVQLWFLPLEAALARICPVDDPCAW